jgi:hypothetical protein
MQPFGCKPGHEAKTLLTMLRDICLSLFLLLLIFQIACTQNDEPQPKPMLLRSDKVADLLGKWRLVKVHTGFPGKLIEKDVNDSRLIFEFNADSTFRYTYFDSVKVAGRFSLKKNDNGQEYLVLTTQSGSTFKHWEGDKVALTPFNTNLLIESYAANDGPIYFYQKVEEDGVK